MVYARHFRSLFALLFSGLLLAGCATAPPPSDPAALAEFERINDPYEPLNRVVFDLNTSVDKLVLKPVANGYRAITPKPVRQGVNNFFRNLGEPLTFIHQLLQGKGKAASRTMGRFVMNSTVGLAGLFDVASDYDGLQRANEDMGQTFAVWGLEEGPYIVLPFFGPSNIRDAIGQGIDIVGDPVGLGADLLNERGLQQSLLAGQVADARARDDVRQALDELNAADDPYVLARSAFRQNRRFAISDRKVTQTEEEEDLFDEDFDDIEFDDDEEDDQPSNEE